MLGKLTRWLRMLGYEANYAKDRPDSELITIAKREGLTLLTSDEQLYRTAAMRGMESFLVTGRTEEERLASLADRFKLNLEIDVANSRCPVCGSPIEEKPKAEVEAWVPAATFKVYKTFWVCTNPKCAKVYWQGSHWLKIEQTLENARRIHEARTSATTRREQVELGGGQTARSNSPPRDNHLPPVQANNPST
jgi:hypothetical protein